MSERGTTKGRYEVTTELGRGSMGIVHLAHDPVMGRDVALKTILLPHGLPEGEKEEFLRRFLREAQTAGRLSHPGIVTVYDFNREGDEDLPFIAMEYVQGYTLHELIGKEGSLDADWCLTMAETLADALQAADDAGIVHRDLKPANIIVREADGVAKITDFGLARVNFSELTDARTTYGSPAYMAPERIRGERADARSDLFSLGVILYETLCGHRPFGGDDFASVCHAILTDAPVSIRDREPSLAPAFDNFFRRALAKAPGDRFPDGSSFREGLEALRHEQILFTSGAATMVMPAIKEEAAESRSTVLSDLEADISAGTYLQQLVAHPALKRLDPRKLRPWTMIGAGAVLLILMSFAAGWLLNGADRVETETPTEPPTVQAAATTSPDVLPPGAPALPVMGAAPGIESFTFPQPGLLDEQGPETTDPPDIAPTTAGRGPAPVRTEQPTVKPRTPRATAAAAAEPSPAQATVPAKAGQEATSAEATQETSGETTGPADLSGQPEPEAASATVASAPDPIVLDILVKSSIKQGQVVLLVDGQELFSEPLDSESRTLNRVYKKVLRKVSQELETTVEIPADARIITAKVYSAPKARWYEATLDVDLEPGEARHLTVIAGRTFGPKLTLELD